MSNSSVITAPQVKPMDGSIYKSALGNQQASVDQHSRLLESTKSGGAIDVPKVPVAYNEQASGSQGTQALSNQINALKAGSAENSKFDKVGGSRRRKRVKKGKSKSKKAKRRRTNKKRYYK